jgi:hypothetical protein
MQHFKVTQRSGGSLTSEFSHDPESLPTSIQDYLEQQFDAGWKLASFSDQANGIIFAFEANGQPE